MCSDLFGMGGGSSDRAVSMEKGIWSWCLGWVRAVQLKIWLSVDGSVGVAVLTGEEGEV